MFGNFAAAIETEAAVSLTPSLSPKEREHDRARRGDSGQSLQQQIDIAVARSFLHRFIGKLFEYPTEESWSWLTSEGTAGAVTSACAVLGLDSAAARLLEAFNSSSYAEFLAAHLSAFGHAARGPVPMNEIEYGDLKADPLFQPHRLADLAAFYRAFGLEIAPDASERQDHVCIEMEFMSVLTAKEAFALEQQLDEDALATCRLTQKSFLREHAGRWLPAFTRRIERSCTCSLLVNAAQFTRAFINADCERCGVKPGSDDLVLRPVDSEADQLCASCGIQNLPPGAAAAE